MPNSNQYQPKLEALAGPDGNGTFYRVSMHDGDEEIFSTTLIPARYKLLADMLHSTLEVAVAFGFFEMPKHED